MVISAIDLEVDGIVQPWNKPVADWKALFPISWIDAANNDCAAKSL